MSGDSIGFDADGEKVESGKVGEEGAIAGTDVGDVAAWEAFESLDSCDALDGAIAPALAVGIVVCVVHG